MSNFRLPPELLDYLFDLLHEEPETLKYCCLISKSWVPRIRKHLFATVEFRFASDLESWKKTFPDPANSPAYHTHTLIVGCPRLVVEADAEEGGWIRAFSRVTRLELDNGTHYISEEVSLAPFFNFSPALKSLRVCIVTFPFPQLFDLIRSSPYLEDLSLKGYEGFQSNDRGRHEPQTGVPSTSPPLTGTLDICITGWMGNTTCRLLELPNGLHFRKLQLWWLREEDLRWLMKLIVSCSRTLECLDIASHLPCASVSILSRSRDLPSSVFQLIQDHLRSTSRRRRDSGIWFFVPNRGASDGSQQRSEPSHPNIKTFDRSRSTCLIT